MTVLESIFAYLAGEAESLPATNDGPAWAALPD